MSISLFSIIKCSSHTPSSSTVFSFSAFLSSISSKLTLYASLPVSLGEKNYTDPNEAFLLSSDGGRLPTKIIGCGGLTTTATAAVAAAAGSIPMTVVETVVFISGKLSSLPPNASLSTTSLSLLNDDLSSALSFGRTMFKKLSFGFFMNDDYIDVVGELFGGFPLLPPPVITASSLG